MGYEEYFLKIKVYRINQRSFGFDLEPISSFVFKDHSFNLGT